MSGNERLANRATSLSNPLVNGRAGMIHQATKQGGKSYSARRDGSGKPDKINLGWGCMPTPEGTTPLISEPDRRQWLADKEARREAALKALSRETDPKVQRKLRASARRYKAMIAMGPERTKAGAGHWHYTQADRD